MEQVITDILQIFSSSTLQTHAELAIWGSNPLYTPIALNKVSNQRNASVQVDTQRHLIFYKINKLKSMNLQREQRSADLSDLCSLMLYRSHIIPLLMKQMTQYK